MSDIHYDVAILGGGPGGDAAALYGSSAGLELFGESVLALTGRSLHG
ncbi:MAG: hypothetical protein ACT4PW_09230 [Acidimicrobiia bacterium]